MAKTFNKGLLYLQNAQSHKLHRRQSEQVLSERRMSESPQPLHPSLGRRLSETNIPVHRTSHGTTVVQVTEVV